MNQSESLTLNCEANGYPKPEVSWHKNSELLVNNQRPFSFANKKYKFNSINGSLTIYDLKSDDSGLYYCFASSLDRYPIASLNYSVIGKKIFQPNSKLPLFT